MSLDDLIAKSKVGVEARRVGSPRRAGAGAVLALALNAHTPCDGASPRPARLTPAMARTAADMAGGGVDLGRGCTGRALGRRCVHSPRPSHQFRFSFFAPGIHARTRSLLPAWASFPRPLHDRPRTRPPKSRPRPTAAACPPRPRRPRAARRPRAPPSWPPSGARTRRGRRPWTWAAAAPAAPARSGVATRRRRGRASSYTGKGDGEMRGAGVREERRRSACTLHLPAIPHTPPSFPQNTAAV